MEDASPQHAHRIWHHDTSAWIARNGRSRVSARADRLGAVPRCARSLAVRSTGSLALHLDVGGRDQPVATADAALVPLLLVRRLAFDGDDLVRLEGELVLVLRSVLPQRAHARATGQERARRVGPLHQGVDEVDVQEVHDRHHRDDDVERLVAVVVQVVGPLGDLVEEGGGGVVVHGEHRGHNHEAEDARADHAAAPEDELHEPPGDHGAAGALTAEHGHVLLRGGFVAPKVVQGLHLQAPAVVRQQLHGGRQDLGEDDAQGHGDHVLHDERDHVPGPHAEAAGVRGRGEIDVDHPREDEAGNQLEGVQEEDKARAGGPGAGRDEGEAEHVEEHRPAHDGDEEDEALALIEEVAVGEAPHSARAMVASARKVARLFVGGS
mmetsp:Transcript_14157/g.47966  ORF Transcript_14157/g.47966 Transcript_14157/m.47966 type:complete len:380 (+) Transcript_14157:421-1560(+)